MNNIPRTKKAQKKYKTEWDFTLFYAHDKDPHIENDILQIEKACEAFARKYKKKTTYITDPKKLLNALRDREHLEVVANSKPLTYFHYLTALDAHDEYAQAQVAKLTSRLTSSYNKLLFFELELGKIEKKKQEELLKTPSLNAFRYYLKKIFNSSHYDLSEAEEKIITIKNQTSRQMWIEGLRKLENKQTVKFDGKNIPLSQAFGIIPTLPAPKRRALHKYVMNQLRSISDFAEAEINAVYTNKKIKDELRGMKEPYEETILRYENEVSGIVNLVDTVTSHFHISQRFYALKAKLLKQKSLTYADRSVVPGFIKKTFDFPSTVALLEKTFEGVDPKYTEMFNTFLMRGQVDVFPRRGKSGGAFCSSDVGTPTVVLLNHTDNFHAVKTVAHEMGHAFHAELSKGQPPLYQGHSTAVAEVASTLFENFVFDEVYESLSDREKIVALHSRLNDDIATVFRQIACFNFELNLHHAIREEGFVSKEKIASMMNEHMRAYLGPAVTLEENDGYFFVAWSHIRNFFYVYSYAYGQLISRALYTKYKEDKTFLNKIEQFLEAGCSKSPFDIFNQIGINTLKPEFFTMALDSIEKDIDRLEKLTQ